MHRAAYFCIWVLIIGGVTMPFNPLLNGAGPASFLYYIFYCVFGLVLLNIVTNRRLESPK
jgi:hypothetical protein